MNLKSASSACIGLVAGSVLALGATPAQAGVLKFGTDGIKFDTETLAEFKFVRSQGDYQSTFGVYEIASKTFTPLFEETKPFDTEADDFLGTCGGTNSAVANCNASFKFSSGVDYSFALLSKDEPTVYSTTSLNDSSQGFAKQAEFSGNDPFASPVLISFEDHPFEEGVSIDFNDFKVSVSTTAPTQNVPEPVALAGLALMGGLILATRRRQISPSS